MKVSRYATHAQYTAEREARDAAWPGIVAHAMQVRATLARTGWLVGHCDMCNADHARLLGTAGEDLRESLRCAACGCNSRQRLAAWCLRQAAATGSDTRLYVTEQTGCFHDGLRRHTQARVTGSEYVPDWRGRWRLQLWMWRHGACGRLRHEDVTALRLADASVDAIVSLDVLEHVPDHRAALREFARVLRTGGQLLLGVPFHHEQPHNVVLAEIDAGGAVRQLIQPPEYHGDPVRGGVLCFHHFGWQLLDELRDAGFASAQALLLHAPQRGIIEPLWMLQAQR